MSDPPTLQTTINPVSPRQISLADAQRFVGILRQIQKEDRGRMSALKRNAGELLGGRGTSWFYSILPKRQAKFREIYYLIATLFDFNRLNGQAGNFGNAMLRLCNNMNGDPKSFRRFHILLDAEFDRVFDPEDPDSPWDGGGELGFRLRQGVKLMASKDVGIDWPELLVDLCAWSDPSRRIQKKWARSFFSDSTPIKPEAVEET